ncbi:MAG TPA: TonB C-terminal domain-containing protein [Polyangia bacterium]|nr:TonB C-terminal domain-containing protein [Polyangia bacterium]
MRRVRPLLLAVLTVCGTIGTAGAADPPGPPEAARPTEPPITVTGAEGDYLRLLHRTIHFRFAVEFIEEVAEKRPATDPLNNPKLETEILFTVRWDGSPAEVTVTEKSGVPLFDQAAVAAVKGHQSFPVPPIDVYGDDGVAHFRWVFSRDPARLCSDGEVRRVEAPLAEALPRLFVQGRVKEALLRVARYTRAGDANAMSTFARAYLAQPFPEPVIDARAAAALAYTGDARQESRLRPALNRPETVSIAAPALAALKVDLCAIVRPRLVATDPAGIDYALPILQAGGEEPPASPCVGALTDLFKNEALAAPVRAEVLRTLAAVSPGGVRRPALNALGERDARLRAAAAAVFARPGGGRPTRYRLQPLVKDPSVDVRAAVAAGLVRACGDLADDYVMPLFKERDVEPLVAMAPELGKLSSAASLDLLAKMQKRNDPALRLPILAALSTRQDAAGRALYQPAATRIKNDPYASAEARRIVYAAADVGELKPLMRDPTLGLMAFKALLRAQRRAEAMDWLVSSFDRLPPETLVEAFGDWLQPPSTHVAGK